MIYHSKKSVCFYCKNKIPIDYKDIENLRRFVTWNGKILPRRISNLCAKHQRRVAKAVKLSRELSLLPYVRAE